MTKSIPMEAPGGFGADNWNNHMGLEILELGPERVRGRVVVDERHHQPYGIAHGGVYCSIVEALASIGAGVAALNRGQAGVVGVSNSTDFLRSHGEGELEGVAQPIHVGRSQQLWAVEIRRTSDGALVARGQVRLHVLQELPAERPSKA